ncbi:hypothetical protein Tco_1449366 [Tanacetum coccineum]
MSTPVNTSSTDSQMHNNIMAAGSKDRPPMLGPGRYSQWRSRFLRYIDTKGNGEYLRKCIFEGPYKLTSVVIEAVAATVNSPEVPQHDEAETRTQHVYSTVDACNTANEMWIAIERLQQEWSRFVTVIKQSKEIETISYHTLFDILKQYQNEVNDIRAERIAKSANPLALLAAAKPYSDNYYQAPKPQRTNTTSSSIRPSASTRHKGKEIAKPVTPQSESVSEEDSDPEQAQRDKDMQKNLALLAKYFKKLYKPTNNNLRTSSNSRNKTEDTTPRKPKRVKDYTYHKEKMMMCKQAEQGVPLQAEQADWLEDTDEEIDEQELEAHYSFMEKIQEDDSNFTPDSSNICNNDNQVDQNAAECVDERATLANLIANLTLDTKENKTILKQLKKANASLTQEMEECKTNLDETNRALGEATSCRDSFLIALQNKQNKFEKYKAFNDQTIDYDICNTPKNQDNATEW